MQTSLYDLVEVSMAQQFAEKKRKVSRDGGRRGRHNACISSNKLVHATSLELELERDNRTIAIESSLESEDKHEFEPLGSAMQFMRRLEKV